MSERETELTVAVRQGMLVIEIGVDTLAFAWSRHPENRNHEGEPLRYWPKVVNAEAFARDVALELTRHPFESASSRIEQLLDEAMQEAVDAGSLGVAEPTT